MRIKHFLSLSDLGPENISYLVKKSRAIANGHQNGAHYLKGKVAGIYFKCSSTRTRTAFTVGALRLGAKTISYGPDDLQIATGETVHDTARVLSGFLDVLVIRTNGGLKEMEELADQDTMAVINAMSDNEHPTQAIADLVTMREALGRLEDVRVLYMGEGNNTAAALALAIAQVRGMELTLMTPEEYGLPVDTLEKACKLAKKYGATVEEYHDMSRLPKGVDVIYTTRWQTMGVKKTDANWIEKFEPFAVTPSVMKRASKPSGTIFLHDLPAVRGWEVDDEVLDGPQSRAFRQAWHKMTSAMAILQWCTGGNGSRSAA